MQVCTQNIKTMAKNKRPLNPFFLSPVIPDNYFCDRQTETESLLRLLLNGSNVLLISPRRMGKSGLIHHLFDQPEIKDHFNTFYIDIYETSSIEELIQKLGQEIVRKLSCKGLDQFSGFLRSLVSLRGVFTLDPISGLPSFSVGIGEIKQPEATLDEIFSYLEKASKPCIVAIDEFQKIADYEQNNVEAVLRSRIQLLRNSHFIFSGSERSVLAQMFGSASRPFYQSTANMSLAPIGREVYADFATRLFNEYGKKLERESVFDLYDLLQGYTYYLQRAMNTVFSLLPEGVACSRQFIFDRIDEILTSNTDAYQDLLSSLTPNQRALLSAVAVEGIAMNIMSAEFINRHGLGSVSSVQTASRSLIKRQLLTRDPQKRYYLDDKFLELWLARPFGVTLEIRLGQNRLLNGRLPRVSD